MDYNSINIEVFVSCPGDVKAEKKKAMEACMRVSNNMIANGDHIRLTFRDFGEVIGVAGKRPQQVINDQITGYHIYIGIMHMKFGTPTGKSNPITQSEFESGTEEEFHEALKQANSNKDLQIYFFFKNQKGSTNVAEHEQAGKVLKFRDSMLKGTYLNHFKSTPEFGNIIVDLLSRICNKIIKDNLLGIKNQILLDSKTKSAGVIKKRFIRIDHLVPDIPTIEYYIPRTVTLFKSDDNTPTDFYNTKNKKYYLREQLLQSKKIVLLGNAGSGKSVELQQLALYFKGSDTPYIPIYKRFNTYTDEAIEIFLPTGWDNINSQVGLLLLDGLDEIQPQHFTTAIRRIIEFAQKNPELRIVISCRTNFYELPGDAFSGSLNTFQAFLLDDINTKQINEYVTKIVGIDGDDFIQKAYEASFLDLIQKPFFLPILIRHYKETGSFSAGRADIIESALLAKFDSDKVHFKNTVDLPRSDEQILSMLEKVAFVMEVMGRNFISDQELTKVLPNDYDFDRIKRFTAFTKNAATGKWMFEHNNIQEFLAARILARKSLVTLKKTISFRPAHKKIKPTWVNTLSFFISIGNTKKVKELVAWLVNTEPQVIVKFEPDRISKTLRIRIFKGIFRSYQKNDLWLRSNQFNNIELTRFADFPETIAFLLGIISDKKTTLRAKLNAMGLLDNFDINKYPAYKKPILDALLAMLEPQEEDYHTIYSLLYSLSNLGIANANITDQLVKKYSKRKNQYVRAGLYKLIIQVDKSDKYIDVLMDGLYLPIAEGLVEDRQSVSLGDEEWLLKEAVEGIKTPKGLRILLDKFKDPSSKQALHVHDHCEIFVSVIRNVIKAYEKDPALFDEMLAIFKASGMYFETQLSEITRQFFADTGNDWKAFISVWRDEQLKDYGKDSLLGLLLHDDLIDRVVTEYGKRNLNNEDIDAFHKILLWFYQKTSEQKEKIKDFQSQIKQLGGAELVFPIVPDWKTINKIKAQSSFDLYFKPTELLKTVKAIFNKLKKTEIINEDLWSFRRNVSQDIEDLFPLSSLDLLRHYSSDHGAAQFKQVKSWIEDNKNFIYYQIREIYRQLTGNMKDIIEVTPAQQKFITDWVKSFAATLEIDEAIKATDISGQAVTIRNYSNIVWYFVRRFKIRLPEKKLLEFTLYYDYERQREKSSKSTIEELESLVSKQKIEKKVIDNLSKEIKVVNVWTNNASYAINNNLTVAHPRILKTLENNNWAEYSRTPILNLYFEKTGNRRPLLQVLSRIGKDELRWRISELLLKNGKDNEFLMNYFSTVMNDITENEEKRLYAAGQLMLMNDLGGFMFAATYVLDRQNPLTDFRSVFTYMTSVSKKETIPVLMKLLFMSRQPAFLNDQFNNFENIVLDTLHNIAIQSESNFRSVKTAVTKFIREKKFELPNLNFLHSVLSRMEEQLYLKKSQDFSVSEAVKEYAAVIKN